jgi:gluconolactonase
MITSAGVEGKPTAPHDVYSSNTSSLVYELIRSPDLAEHWLKAGAYLRGAVPRKLGEVAILVTARHLNAQYTWWSHHTQYADKFGVSREVVEAIAQGRRPEWMQPDEEAVYNFCTELLQNNKVSDAAFEAAKTQLGGEQGVVDLIALIGFYQTNSMLMIVDRYPLPDGVKPELTPITFDAGHNSVLEKPVVKVESALDAVVAQDARMEMLYRPERPTDFEGPTWIREGRSGYLIFSERPGNTINKLTASGKISVFADKVFTGELSEKLWNSNGTTLDRQGRVVFCASSAGAIIRLEKNGKRTILTDRFDGTRFNTPNDLVYRSDGSLYFTDSGTSLQRKDGVGLPYVGLYLLKRGKVQLLTKEIARPNGLAFSPDEKYLYLIDTPTKIILRFDVNRDGTISNRTTFIDTSADPVSGILDGMKVDKKGNIYTTGPGGVWVVSSEGKHIGTILTAARATNLTFGGADAKWLYITGTSFVARISLKVAGLRP